MFDRSMFSLALEGPALTGMSRADLLDALGEPDLELVDGCCDQWGLSTIARLQDVVAEYYQAHAYLCVSYDDDDRAVDAKIRVDFYLW